MRGPQRLPKLPSCHSIQTLLATWPLYPSPPLTNLHSRSAISGHPTCFRHYTHKHQHQPCRNAPTSPSSPRARRTSSARRRRVPSKSRRSNLTTLRVGELRLSSRLPSVPAVPGRECSCSEGMDGCSYATEAQLTSANTSPASLSGKSSGPRRGGSAPRSAIVPRTARL